MSGGREATSEQLSLVRKGAGYDKVYPSGCEPKKDLTQSPAREPSTHSPAEGEEGYQDEEGEEGEEGDVEE